MKKLKREVSVLLAVALMLSCFALDFGMVPTSAFENNLGTGVFRVDVQVAANNCANARRGTNSSYRLDLLDTGNNIVASSPTLSGMPGAGVGEADPLENNQTTSYTFDGADTGANVLVTVPGLATMDVNKSITKLRFIEVEHEDEFVHRRIIVYYLLDGEYVEIGRHEYDGNEDQFNAVGDFVIFNTPWFTGNVKTLTFSANGGTPTYTYDAIPGQTITTPLAPTREGYTFNGWNPAVHERMPNANTTYAAQWLAFSYAVSYNGNGADTGTMPNSAHDYGVEKNLSLNGYSKTGYAFSGWATSAGGNVEFSDGENVINLTSQNGGVVVLYAVWVPITYGVIYNGNGATGGSTPTSSHTYDLEGALSTNGFIKTGHTFAGWSDSPAGTVKYTNGQPVLNLVFVQGEDITLYAVWTANSYLIGFNANGGVGGLAPVLMTYGDELIPPTVTREGHLFISWIPTPTDTVPAEDITYIAEWVAMGYTITFDANEGVGGTINTLAYGSDLIAPVVTRDGYVFAGWVPEPPPTVPAENATYTAQWEVRTYEIVFDANGGSGGEIQTLNFGDVPIPPTVIRTGYSFAGWVPAIVAVTDDATYTAQWEAITHQITFDANGGEGGEVQTVNEGTVPIPPTVTKEGHTFTGWLPDIQEASEDAIYTAQWIINSYTVTFDANGGEGGEVQTLDFGSVPMPPSVTRDGFTLIGWMPEVVAVTGDATYTAQWAVNTYQITFDADGGEGGEVLTVDEGAIPIPPTVSRDGYTFAGWLPEIQEANEDATYTAQWTINAYTVVFDANGGEGGETQILNYGTVPEAPDVSREGYTFVGWIPGVVAVTQDTTYTAQWLLDTYEITFDADGGQGGAVLTLNYGDIPEPPTVTREGYIFVGWSPAIVMVTQAATYTAQWIEDLFTVTFDLNQGTGTVPDAQTASMGSLVTLPAQGDIERAYYIFLGWSESADAVIPLPEYVMPGEDTVLYAVWSRVPVSLAVKSGQSAIIDDDNMFIYGLEEGLARRLFVNKYIEVQGDGEMRVTIYGGSFGTGTKVELIDRTTLQVVNTYHIVIFGDVDGDGYITGSDANLMAMAAADLYEFESGSAFAFAADVNRNGEVDEEDLALVRAHLNYLSVIDQSNPLQGID